MIFKRYFRIVFKPSNYEINDSNLNHISDIDQLSDKLSFKVAVTYWRQYVIAAENKCKDMG